MMTCPVLLYHSSSVCQRAGGWTDAVFIECHRAGGWTDAVFIVYYRVWCVLLQALSGPF